MELSGFRIRAGGDSAWLGSPSNAYSKRGRQHAVTIFGDAKFEEPWSKMRSVFPSLNQTVLGILMSLVRMSSGKREHEDREQYKSLGEHLSPRKSSLKEK